MNLYTVKDLASETYLRPFCMLTDRDAIDGFKHVCNDPETPYAKHPADYELHALGSFDERTGILTVSSKKITRALDMIKELKNDGENLTAYTAKNIYSQNAEVINEQL